MTQCIFPGRSISRKPLVALLRIHRRRDCVRVCSLYSTVHVSINLCVLCEQLYADSTRTHIHTPSWRNINRAMHSMCVATLSLPVQPPAPIVPFFVLVIYCRCHAIYLCKDYCITQHTATSAACTLYGFALVRVSGNVCKICVCTRKPRNTLDTGVLSGTLTHRRYTMSAIKTAFAPVSVSSSVLKHAAVSNERTFARLPAFVYGFSSAPLFGRARAFTFYNTARARMQQSATHKKTHSHISTL